MLRSMTGFGRAHRDTPQGRLSVEIRAVNSRFNETRVRLPAEVLDLEMRLREEIKAALARGKIDCQVRLEPLPGSESAAVNPEAFRRTFEALHRATVGVPLAQGVTVGDVLRAMPREDAAADLWREEEFQGLVSATLGEALGTLDESRRAEGARIAEGLAAGILQIEEATAAARQAAPQMVEAFTERLKQRLAELGEKIGADPDSTRIEQEIVMFANRVDVTEELDRLQMHCAAFREVLDKDEPVGRRMDFLVQEVLREVNTLGSKARDTEISPRVIDLKVLIEQMREQVQNLE